MKKIYRSRNKISLLESIKKPENIPYGFAILIALIISVLGILKVASIEILIGVVLLVLGSIASLLIISHKTMLSIKDEIEYPSIGKLFYRFQEIENEFRNSIRNAEEVWLLSRTGQGWWKNFKDEFNQTRQQKMHFLFISPQSHALELVAKRRKPDWLNYPDMSLKDSAIKFLNYLKKNYSVNIDLKVIDYLPAWSLLIVNPNKKTDEAVIYVELAKYYVGPKGRPIFKINSYDSELFLDFIQEYKTLWDHAEKW